MWQNLLWLYQRKQIPTTGEIIMSILRRNRMKNYIKALQHCYGRNRVKVYINIFKCHLLENGRQGQDILI